MTMTLPERPAELVEPEDELDLGMLRFAIENTVGDRYKVEILGGSIIVSPMARNIHALIVAALVRLLARSLTDEYIVSERLEFVVDKSNSPQPDLAVLPHDALRARMDETTNLPSEALLVVEVTSPSNAMTDRKWGLKYKAYAKGMVPAYLLVDLYADDGPSMTLFTEPNGRRYLAEQTVPFGKKLHLPEPFADVVIDSSGFPRPGS
jgi:Uma2 family endonuclease